MPVIDTTTAQALLGDLVHGLGEARDGAAGHTRHADATVPQGPRPQLCLYFYFFN